MSTRTPGRAARGCTRKRASTHPLSRRRSALEPRPPPRPQPIPIPSPNPSPKPYPIPAFQDSSPHPIQAAERALALEPCHFGAHAQRGAALRGLRRFGEALEAYEEAPAACRERRLGGATAHRPGPLLRLAVYVCVAVCCVLLAPRLLLAALRSREEPRHRR